MTRVLHVLPHRGGGAETYIDLLEGIPGTSHERYPLASARTALGAAPSLAARVPRLRRRARGFDVVHVHGDVAAMLALAPLHDRSWMWTTHGLHMLRRAPGPAAGFGVRRVVASSRLTLCTSAAERGELRALAGGADAKLRVVLNGIEPPAAVDPAVRSAARCSLGLDGDAVAVLYLGQLEARKGVLDAVHAARGAYERAPGLVLLVAGEGPLAAEIGALAGEAVRPLGFRDDVDALMAAADIFVMPSEREGLSFAVLEAMGHGLPMVVADGPGNPEAVGEAGIVLPVGDRHALADTLVRLAGDSDERVRLGAAARQRVIRTLTAQALRDGVSDAYRAATLARP